MKRVVGVNATAACTVVEVGKLNEGSRKQAASMSWTQSQEERSREMMVRMSESESVIRRWQR